MHSLCLVALSHPAIGTPFFIDHPLHISPLLTTTLLKAAEREGRLAAAVGLSHAAPGGRFYDEEASTADAASGSHHRRARRRHGLPAVSSWRADTPSIPHVFRDEKPCPAASHVDAQAGVVPGANENRREGLVAGLLRRHGRKSAGLQAAEADALRGQRTVGVDATGGAVPLAAVPYDATENGGRAPPSSTMALPDTEVLPEATGEAAVILGTLRIAAAGKGPRPWVATPETGDATPPSEPSRLHQTGAGVSAAAASKSKNGVEETRGRLEHETEAQHSADEGGDTGGARRAPSSASAADPPQAPKREPDARWRPDELERRLQAEVQVLMAVEESASCRGQAARWFSP